MAHRSTQAAGTHLLMPTLPTPPPLPNTETHTEDLSSNWPYAQSTHSPALASFYLQSLALRRRSRATPRLHGFSRSQLLQASHSQIHTLGSQPTCSAYLLAQLDFVLAQRLSPAPVAGTRHPCLLTSPQRFSNESHTPFRQHPPQPKGCSGGPVL